MTRKEPMFYSLIKSYDSLNNTVIPSREQCIDDMKGEKMHQDEYDHMMKLWKTFNIKTWGEYYELYNVLDVTLMADAFKHFRNATLNAFGIDPIHFITTLQMAYSLFLKVTMARMHWRHWVRNELSVSYESMRMMGWWRRIWRRSSFIAWTSSIEIQTFD